jgi:hypothetical protein
MTSFSANQTAKNKIIFGKEQKKSAVKEFSLTADPH